MIIRILTESDGPFAQVEGSPALPWQVENALKALGEIWSVQQEDVTETLNRNLRALLAKHNAHHSIEVKQ